MAKLNQTSKLHSMIVAMNETQATYLKDYLNTNNKTVTSKDTLGDNEATALIYYKGITGVIQKIASGKYYLLSCGEKNCFIYYIENNVIDDLFESCSLLEVKFEVEKAAGGTDGWVESVKDKIVYNTTDSEIEIGTKLEVDGASTFNTRIEIGESSSVSTDTLLDVHGNSQVHGDMILDSLANIVNPDDNKLIHVISKVEFEGGSFVTKTNTVYIVYDTDGTCYVKYYVS